MSYRRPNPTVAELLRAEGYRTEIITRNSIFDGSIPGICRGFQKNTVTLAQSSGLNPLSVLLALSKPRFRRQIMATGFFHPAQRTNRQFVATFARATVPADRQALHAVLDSMTQARKERVRYFLFCNLYDVHAPYPPSENSIFRSLSSLRGLIDLGAAAFVFPKLGSHAYLREGFRMPSFSRKLLLDRYHDAIRLMDEKLSDFYHSAVAARLLDDTILIIVSDHGEGFGEHGLYLHDASLFETHLHVPLYIHHPDGLTGSIDDVVTTRDLFGVMLAAARRGRADRTILDPEFRRENSIAIAEHFHYPHIPDAQWQYRHDLIAAVTHDTKVLIHPTGIRHYNLSRDAAEQNPETGPLDLFDKRCRERGVSQEVRARTMDRLRPWAADASIEARRSHDA